MNPQVVKRSFYFPSYSKWVLLVLLISMSWVYGYQKILFLRPQGVHQWRQCDCLSMTMCYYQDRNSFFEPAIQNLGNGTGKAAAEFPLLYYLVAQLWKIFGAQEFIYRLVVILVSFTGLFALFRLTEETLKDSFWALWITGLLFTSPLLVYYTNNFLVNVPALALALAGFYYFRKYYLSGREKYLIFFCLCFLIAGLLKVTAIAGLFVVAVIFILEKYIGIRFKDGENIFPSVRKCVLPFIIVLASIASWYLYVSAYNKRFNEFIFLTTPLPAWKLGAEDFQRVLNAIWENVRWNYFRPAEEWVLLIMFVLVIIQWRKVNRLLLVLTIVFSACFLAFVILFFKNLDVHDYYMIDFLVLMPLISLTFLSGLRENYFKVFNSVFLRVIAVAFLVHNMDFAMRRIEGRYNADSYLNENRTKFTYALEDVTPFLRSLGISEQDTVICFPDSSPDISLYLINQKGWTQYNVPVDSVVIREKIKMGVKYLIIYDPALYADKNLSPFLGNKIGQYKIVDVYKL